MKRRMKQSARQSTRKARRWCKRPLGTLVLNPSFKFSDYALLVLLAAIFASNFMMTKIAVHALPPMLVVAARVAIAAGILFAVMVLAGKWFPRGAIWKPLIASAFFGHTLPFALLAWGQQRVDAGLAAIMMATMPLFTLFLAQLFTKDEKPNRYSVAGFAIALIGIIILFGPDKLASLADQSIRQYAIMAAAMSYGVNAIITKQLTGIAWQQSAASFMVAAFVLCLPLLFWVDFGAVEAPLHVWAVIAYTGIMPTAVGAIFIVLIIRRTNASFLSQINFMVPVFGVLFAVAFVNEVLPPNAAIALLIILTGVALARRRPKRELVSINKGV